MKKINIFLDWLLKMLIYTFLLGVMSQIFKNSIQIDKSIYFLWGLIASIIIYILNKTIKPLITWITLPITGLTLGLFYPFINVIILKIADFILGKHFETGGILITCLIAILISLFNMIMDHLIIDPILERE